MDAKKYIGVSYDPTRNSWKARIHIAGAERYIGRFNTAKEAAVAYDQAARLISALYHTGAANAEHQVIKRNRRLNFPDLHSNDTAVRDRVLSILKTVAPEVLQSAQADVSAAASAEVAAADALKSSPQTNQMTAAAAAGAQHAARTAGTDTDPMPAVGGVADAAAHALNETFPATAAERSFSWLWGTTGASAGIADTAGEAAAAAAGRTSAAANNSLSGSNAAAAAPGQDTAEVCGAAATRRASKPGRQSRPKGGYCTRSSSVKRPYAAAATAAASVKLRVSSVGAAAANENAVTAEADPLAACAASTLHPGSPEVQAACDGSAAASGPESAVAAGGAQQCVPVAPSRAAALDAAAAVAGASDAAAAHLQLKVWQAQHSDYTGQQQQQQQQQQQPNPAQANAHPKNSKHEQLPPPPAAAASAACQEFMESRDWANLLSFTVGDHVEDHSLSLDPVQDLCDLSRPTTAQRSDMRGSAPKLCEALQVTGRPESQGSSDGGEPLHAMQQLRSMQDAAARAGNSSSSTAQRSLLGRVLTTGLAGECPLTPGGMRLRSSSAGPSGANGDVLGSSRAQAAEPQGMSPRMRLPSQHTVGQPPAPAQVTYMGWASTAQQVPVAGKQQQQQGKLSLQPPALLPLTCCKSNPQNQADATLVAAAAHAPWGAAELAAAGPLAVGTLRGVSMKPSAPHTDGAAGTLGLAGSFRPAEWLGGSFGAVGTGRVGTLANMVPVTVPGMANAARTAAEAPPTVACAASAVTDGLFASIHSTEKGIAVFSCCLEALADLELHLSQQPRHVSAVGAMVDWINAAWHGEAVSQQADLLEQGPAAMAAAVAAAKAQLPSASTPAELALQLLDKLMLLVARALSELQADVTAQRSFLCELLMHLRQGFRRARDAVSPDGYLAAMYREFLRVWAAHIGGTCSSPAIGGVLVQLMQLV